MDEAELRLQKLRRVQIEQIELIRAFVEICKSEKLVYFMLDGTMLGAVRHNAYIPWDDDADFGMPRPDYERFLSVASQHLTAEVRLETYQNTDNYCYYFSRLASNKNKIQITNRQDNIREFVWIDIFPLDGMPNGVIARKIHMFRLLYRKMMFQFSRFSQAVNLRRKRIWYERVLVSIGKSFPIEKLLSKEKQWVKLDNALKKFPYEKSSIIVHFLSEYRFKEMFQKEVFSDGASYTFEGMQLNGPLDYDFYLTQVYGDYMTPPPESERNKHFTEIQE